MRWLGSDSEPAFFASSPIILFAPCVAYEKNPVKLLRIHFATRQM
jgi:hypothetical protein